MKAYNTNSTMKNQNLSFILSENLYQQNLYAWEFLRSDSMQFWFYKVFRLRLEAAEGGRQLGRLIFLKFAILPNHWFTKFILVRLRLKCKCRVRVLSSAGHALTVKPKPTYNNLREHSRKLLFEPVKLFKITFRFFCFRAHTAALHKHTLV
jgi:hypothetical protein